MESAQLDEARREVEALGRARPRDPNLAFAEGNLRFLEGDYAGAVDRLKAAADAGDQAAQALGRLVDSTLRVTASHAKAKSAHFELSHPPGKDAVLVPYALETLERAYAALAEDFGEEPPAPVRVEIYSEVEDLARVSPLTLREIETSGTIALCKYNRLMIVSPRALLAGYPWLDTLTHEYTHFVVTRASHNRVPIWLHEGLAKYEERRWRGSGGGGLSPTMEHLLKQGIDRKRLITFAEMHPSMAKLPSQEDAALAFAEVYMVIEYLVGRVGWAGIRKVVAQLRAGQTVEQAVGGVVGTSFETFQQAWRAWLVGRGLKARPGLVPTALRFRRGDKRTEAADDDAASIPEARARAFARLGGMLRARRRLEAAALEYEKARALLGPLSAPVAHKLARTYLELGDAPGAIAAAGPALEAYPELSGPLATVGAAFVKQGDPAKAAPYLEQAIAISPFDPQPHCDLARIWKDRGDPRAAREAEACRALAK